MHRPVSRPVATVRAQPNSPRWPIGLWLGQAVVPAVLLGYGGLRLVYGPELNARLITVLILSGVWLTAVVASACVGRFRSRLVSRRRQLALCFGSTLLAVAACDVGLTLTGVVPTIAELRAESLEYRRAVYTRQRLAPKTFLVGGSKQLTINRRGYLGPEIAIPKPPGTTRIVFLGESQVFAAIWSEGENWPELAGEILARRGRKVDVINAGVPGHQTADCLGKLLTDLWLLKPDVLVVCGAWNDIKYFSELTPERPYCDIIRPAAGWDPRIEPRGIDRVLCLSSLYRLGHTGLVTMLAGTGDEGEILKPPVGRVSPYAVEQYRLNLQMICDLGRNIGAQVVLCKQARLPVQDSSQSDRRRIPYDYTGLPHDELLRAFAACDRAVEEVAAEKGCRVIDMNAPLSGKSDLFADHIHFNRHGDREAAAVVADGLETTLGGK